MSNTFAGTFRIAFFLVFITILSGCVDNEHSGQSVHVKKKYSIYAMMRDGKEYIIQTDSLAGGFVNPEKGAQVVPAPMYYDLIVHNGSYFRLNWKTKSFEKYQIKDNIFTKNAELSLSGISAIENYNWIGPDSLLIIGFDEKSLKVKYAKIQVEEMKAVQGEMEIPSPFEAYNWMSIGFSKFTDDNKLLIGYAYHTTTNLNSYTTGDTIYVETLSYPGMKSLGRYRETRSVYPGGMNTRQPHSFTDENGDFYFIACPGIASGNMPDKPTGIFRIKKSETTIDPDYFFNISSSPVQNHGYGFWYIGNGKAIVRTERKGFFAGMKDHYKVAQFDFYVLDLESKNVNRLGLPLDKGTARQCVLVENGLVYITVNSNSEGNYVWIYNPKTGNLKKGMQFEGDVDYILRLDRLN
jgi:hypothetical protein